MTIIEKDISHAVAKVSYKDSLEVKKNITVFIGEKYKKEIKEQNKSKVELDLSQSSDCIYYAENIDQMRKCLMPTPNNNFIIRSYLLYSNNNHNKSKKSIISFGGNSVGMDEAKHFLLESVSNSNDTCFISKLIEVSTGYKNEYDMESKEYKLTDTIYSHARSDRMKDEKIIENLFHSKGYCKLSDKEIISQMRDSNSIPKEMLLNDEFIALEPRTLIQLSTKLIEA